MLSLYVYFDAGPHSLHRAVPLVSVLAEVAFHTFDVRFAGNAVIFSVGLAVAADAEIEGLTDILAEGSYHPSCSAEWNMPTALLAWDLEDN